MKPQFIQVGLGRLALYHRPGGKAFADLLEQGCTHVVTLLRASEQAESIGQNVQEKGMVWLWVPIPNGDYPRGEIHERLVNAIPQISALLDEGASVLIHCSAGIHRTGMLGYGLLRWRGLSQEEALEKIGQTRQVTHDGLLPRHIRWGDEVARQV
jgi:protein-tyrosine phosphatase